MKEYRCKFCHKLLFKFKSIADVEKYLVQSAEAKAYSTLKNSIEIKCPKCKKNNEIFEEQLIALAYN